MRTKLMRFLLFLFRLMCYFCEIMQCLVIEGEAEGCGRV